MESGVFGDDRLDQLNRLPLSIHGNDASCQIGNHLSGGAGDHNCDAIPAAPCVAENIRDYCMRAVPYFNVFVLLVQSFEKVPQSRAIAPTRKEPPFAIAQILVLALFVVLTMLAVKRFRIQETTVARASVKTA